MNSLLILVGLLVVVISLLARSRGFDGLKDGGSISFRLVRSVAMMILLGMLLAGMAQVVLPTEAIGQWMGSGSGMTGLLIATAAGIFIPAGPYVVLPLAGSVMAAGAGPGPVAAFLTSWSVIPLHRTVVFEMPFLGGRFTLARLIVNLPYPIVVGLLTPPVFKFFS